MLLAHFSDIHVANEDDYRAPGEEGWIPRVRKHSEALLLRLLADMAAQGPEHVVLTGDLTQTSKREQFERARAQVEAFFPSTRTTVIPGNHDRWCEEAMRGRYYERSFGDWALCELEGRADVFPFCHLHGELALIALDSSPFEAGSDPAWVKGHVSTEQLRRLERMAADPRVAERFLVVLLHHHLRLSEEDERLEDPKDPTPLVNADEVMEALGRTPVGLVLHGHRHKQMRLSLTMGGREVPVICPGSATRVDVRPERTARYNLYRIGDGGLEEVRTRYLDPETDDFRWQDGD